MKLIQAIDIEQRRERDRVCYPHWGSACGSVEKFIEYVEIFRTQKWSGAVSTTWILIDDAQPDNTMDAYAAL